MTYSQAMQRLQAIVEQIESNDLEIDALADKIKEANDLVAFCTQKLSQVDAQVEKLMKKEEEE